MDKEKDTKKKPAVPAQPRQRRSAGEYFRGVRTEIKKVIWPTRKELGSFTAVVLIACTFFSIVFWAVDTGFLALLKAVLGINMG